MCVDGRAKDPTLNACVLVRGTVLAALRTKDEFYQPLTYKDDVDLEKKLAVWERFYNNDRPHGAHKGKVSCEVLREKLRQNSASGLIRNITLRKLCGRSSLAYIKSRVHGMPQE